MEASQQQASTSASEPDQENDPTKVIAELIRTNGILKANISTLYRTARAEIARKNERISELQAQLDDLLFKRMNRASQSGALNKTVIGMHPDDGESPTGHERNIDGMMSS